MIGIVAERIIRESDIGVRLEASRELGIDYGADAFWQTMAIRPDCGCWMLADGKIRALARGRDPYEGRH